MTRDTVDLDIPDNFATSLIVDNEPIPLPLYVSVIIIYSLLCRFQKINLFLNDRDTKKGRWSPIGLLHDFIFLRLT